MDDVDNDVDENEMETVNINESFAPKASSTTGPANLSMKSSSRRDLFRVLYLSICIVMNFLGFVALLPLMSSLYKEAGAVATALTNLVFAISSVYLAPITVQRLGVKKALLLSSTGYLVWCLSALYPTMWCLSLGATYTGILTSILWSAQVSYVTFSSTPETIGKHTGAFWMIFLSVGPLGNSLGSFILSNWGVQQFIWTLIILCMVSMVMFVFLPNVDDSPLKNVVLSTNPVQTTKDMIQLIKTSPALRWCTIPFMYFGFSVGFVQAWYPARIIIPKTGIEKVGITMVCFGAIDAIVAPFIGKLCDLYGTEKLFVLCHSIALGCVILITCSTIFDWTFSIVVYDLIAMGFGIADSAMNVCSNSFMGGRMKDKIACTVAYYRMVSGVVAFLAFAAMYLLPDLVAESLAILGLTASIFSFYRSSQVEA
eukprot:PhF_6_TR8863/c0_g1_i1/m.14030